MKKTLPIVLTIICLLSIGFFANGFMKNNSFAKNIESAPILDNEKIEYRVKLRGLSIGKAELSYDGIVKLDNKDVHRIVFYTDTVNFKDEEIMYADIDSFLPIRIERDINNWGKKINIIEEYDHENNSVKITRKTKKGDKVEIIKRDAKIQNVILSIFLHRKLNDIDIGNDFSINLPLRKIIMRITKTVALKVPSGKYTAYLAESFPKGHKIWFETSDKRIPVKISGPFFLGSVSMEMKNYSIVENNKIKK